MARPKATDPRSAQLLIRLTAGDMNVLESIAHLERTTPNAYARRLLENHLMAIAAHPHVQRDLANRGSYQSQQAAATPLPPAADRADVEAGLSDEA